MEQEKGTIEQKEIVFQKDRQMSMLPQQQRKDSLATAMNSVNLLDGPKLDQEK